MNKKINSYRSKLAYAAIAVVSFILMILVEGAQHLWLDEMYQVGYVCSPKRFIDCIIIDPCTPPLFNMISYVWYRIAPYGERWLVLLSEIFFACSVFMIGMCGEKIKNAKVGIIAAALLGCNSFAIIHGAYEFRTYGLLILLTELVLFIYFMRSEQIKSGIFDKRTVLWLGAAMTLLGYTHYFGLLLCVVLFGIDFILFLKKKLNKQFLKSHIILAICYLPWVYFAVKKYVTINADAGAQLWMHEYRPGILDLIIPLVCIAVLILLTLSKKIRQAYKNEILIAAIITAVYLIVATYAYLTPNAITLWVPRYFLELYPCMILLVSLFAVRFFEWLKAVLKIKEFIIGIAAGIVILCLYAVSFRDISTEMKNEVRVYYKISKLIEANSGSKNPLFIDNKSGKDVFLAMNEYYLTKMAAVQPVATNIINVTKEDIQKSDTVFVLLTQEARDNREINKALKDNYISAKELDLNDPNYRMIMYTRGQTAN